MNKKYIDEKPKNSMVGKNTWAENHTKFTKNKNSLFGKQIQFLEFPQCVRNLIKMKISYKSNGSV